MKGLIILLGGSFRKGSQGNTSVGLSNTYDEQMKGFMSQINLCKHLYTNYNIECHIGITTYSTIYDREFKFYFNNGMIQYNDNTLFEYFPRNTFDSLGKFTKPKKKILKKNLDLSNISIENSIDYFLKIVKSNKSFTNINLNSMIKTNKIILNSKIK